MGTDLTASAPAMLSAATQESLLVGGDLAKLTPSERVKYYISICKSVGVNPMTRPFEYLTLNGKMVLYARKDCTEQLRQSRGISLQIVESLDDRDNGTYTVKVKATLPDGRSDEACGSAETMVQKMNVEYSSTGKEKKVYPKDADGNPLYTVLKGNDRANAIMKAETKAKRRATLSICGLGFLDETEIETIPARAVKPAEKSSVEQRARILELCKNNPDTIAANVRPFGVKTVNEMSVEQADDCIRFLENAAL